MLAGRGEADPCAATPPRYMRIDLQEETGMSCSSKFLGILGVGVFFMCTAVRADLIQFTSALVGAQAADCLGTGSAGTGSGTLTLDTATGIVSYNITFSGLGSPETSAHVHGPAVECVGAVGIYVLSAGSPKIGTSPPLSAQDQADMIAGLHFINIHTVGFSGGEIRGQIGSAPIPAVSVWGFLVMILLIITAGALVFVRGRGNYRGFSEFA